MNTLERSEVIAKLVRRKVEMCGISSTDEMALKQVFLDGYKEFSWMTDDALAMNYGYTFGDSIKVKKVELKGGRD